MKTISSRDNPYFKELKQLAASAQARRDGSRTLLDGVHLCLSYLQHGRLPLACVISESAAAHPEVAEIAAQCDAAAVRCILLPDTLYRQLSQVINGIGVLFVIDVPRLHCSGRLAHYAVLLDQIQDPGNLGSILRSAAAAGITQVYSSNGTVAAWSPKVLRAGMGAHFALEIFENVDLAQVIASAGVPVLATSSHAKKHVYELDLKRPLAWLFGHEGQGVAQDLMRAATELVAIPHLGKVESLNVAASAAICFFEQVRQRVAPAPSKPSA